MENLQSPPIYASGCYPPPIIVRGDCAAAAAAVVMSIKNGRSLNPPFFAT